jgi:hypothetical protein
MAIALSRGWRRVFRYGRITPLMLAVVVGGVIALLVSVAALAQTQTTTPTTPTAPAASTAPAAPVAQITPPADAKAGRFTAQQLPSVQIDGRDYRLAPGARIYSRDRLTMTPNLVPADSAVKFVLNEQGAIQTVWLIDPKELPRGERRTGPRSN